MTVDIRRTLGRHLSGVFRVSSPNWAPKHGPRISRCAVTAEFGCWGATEQNAELRILFQIQSTIKSGVEFANALWTGI
jgi:hypothetical protein